MVTRCRLAAIHHPPLSGHKTHTENAKLLREDSRQLRRLSIHLTDGYLINNSICMFAACQMNFTIMLNGLLWTYL
jgi:hypothetical protein